jgi:type VI protein secretion system component Hcp
VNSMTWGLGREGAVPAFQGVTLSFDAGSWSGAMAVSAASGQPIRRVVLDRTATFADGIRKLITRIVLDDAVVRSLAGAGQASARVENQQVQLVFGVIHWEYYSYDTHGVLTAVGKGGWSVRDNKSL